MQRQFEDDDWGYQPHAVWLPKSSIPKNIGILNIVFGSILLLCGVCSGLNLVLQSGMGPMFAAQQQQFQQLQEAAREKQLRELEKQEQAAANEEDKAALKAKHDAIKAMPQPKMPDITKFANDPVVQAYGITDVVTALILNTLLVVSGLGLIFFKEWARQLCMWVAALKIVRLVVLGGFFAFVVVPTITMALTSMMSEMFDEMAKTAPKGQRVPGQAELDQMGTILGLVYGAGAIVFMILGLIYPVVTLVLLSRPRAKAACAIVEVNTPAREPGP